MTLECKIIFSEEWCVTTMCKQKLETFPHKYADLASVKYILNNLGLCYKKLNLICNVDKKHFHFYTNCGAH